MKWNNLECEQTHILRYKNKYFFLNIQTLKEINVKKIILFHFTH